MVRDILSEQNMIENLEEDSGAIDVSKLRSRLRSMTESPLEFLLLLDRRGGIRFASSEFCRCWGLDLTQVLGTPFSRFFVANERSMVKEYLENLASQPIETEVSLFIGVKAEERRFMRWKFIGIHREGRLEKIAVTGRDIVSQQMAEHLISEQDRQLRTMMANLPGMVYRCRNDEQMTLEFVSEGALALTGFMPAELIENRHKSYSELILPVDRERVKQEMARAVESRQPYQFTYRLVRRDGREIWAREQGCAIYKKSGRVRYLEGIIMDVSKERILEDQLQYAQKMEAVGQLAGGVAHDFNNMLQVVLSYTEQLIENSSLPDEEQASLNHIYSASLRARDLVQQLLAFGRRQLLEPERLDLKELIIHMTELLPRVLGENIRLNFRCRGDRFHVLADSGAIEQVIMNLCLNARDAMPGGGEITVELYRMELGEESGFDLEPGNYIAVSVRDEGIGMNADLQSHIFEPFFTTKGVGEGSGLGLATVYGIIKQHNGGIEVKSEPGKGSIFRVLLREMEPEEFVADGLKALSRTGMPEAGRILVVEDDALVRQLVVNTLVGSGRKVDEAVTFVEAIRLLKQNSWEYDLVICDLGLPDGRGNDLLAQVRLNSSKPRLMLMSGFIDESSNRDGLFHIIRKPFRGKELIGKITELMGV